MPYHQVYLLRSELYRKIWEKPLAQIATELKISEQSITKACRRYKIPMPGREYWESQQANQYLQPPPLPELREDEENLHQVRMVSITRKILDPIHNEKLQALVELEADPKHKIVVNPNRPISDAITLWIRKKLSSAETHDGRLYDRKLQAVFVSKAELPRALSIIDTLLRVLAARGFKPILKEKRDGMRIIVGFLDEEISFRIIEHVRLIKALPKSASHHPKIQIMEDTHHLLERKILGHEPTGILSLELDAPFSPFICSDRVKSRLEDRLNEFLIEMYRRFDFLINRRAERVDREKNWKINQHAEMLHTTRLTLFQESVSQWEKISAFHRFVGEAENCLLEYDFSEEMRQQVRLMLAWIKENVLMDFPSFLEKLAFEFNEK